MKKNLWTISYLIGVLSLLSLPFITKGDRSGGIRGEISLSEPVGGETDEIIVTYAPKDGSNKVLEVRNAPRFFVHLPLPEIKKQVIYYLENQYTWSERVLLEKLAFGLVYGTTGLPRDSGNKYGVARDAESSIPKSWESLNMTANYCKWEGITCGRDGSVRRIQLRDLDLEGTLPSFLNSFSSLDTFDCERNLLQGSIPTEWASMTSLKLLILNNNRLTGPVPTLPYVVSAGLAYNRLEGSLPSLVDLTNLEVFDVMGNKLTGSLPSNFLEGCNNLREISLGKNQITGKLPPSLGGLTKLTNLRFGSNQFNGKIPKKLWRLEALKDVALFDNLLTGTVPTEILRLTTLQTLYLHNNMLTGSIPRGDDVIPGVGRVRPDGPSGRKWESMENLVVLNLSGNRISGALPPEFLYGLKDVLKYIDLSSNELTGTIPAEIAGMSALVKFSAANNILSGQLPSALDSETTFASFNFTNNRLKGKIPRRLCETDRISDTVAAAQFGCDAVLCPPGFFHPSGAASRFSACRLCPRDDEGKHFLGQTMCGDVAFVHGDINGDGILDDREVLRLLYVENRGEDWGDPFSDWADISHDECELLGVTCIGGVIAKIDLTEANVCWGIAKKNLRGQTACKGIPPEISTLTGLEVLQLPRKPFLDGSIPSEIGKLTKLRYLDVSGCSTLSGTIPTEVGLLTQLQFLDLSGCSLSGTIPTEIFSLSGLEKLNLSQNPLTGKIPSEIRHLTALKELMVSRLKISGSIPTEVGLLSAIENIEVYGNQLTGSIPSEIGDCSSIKRIDLFNNKLNGTIPDQIARLQPLQIIHFKMNQLSGTLPNGFGALPFLSWFDVSNNKLHGTIPPSFGGARLLKDFRIGGNMIYGSIPASLCTNTNINGGITRLHACDGVVCPMGTFSETGHASLSDGCKPCLDGMTTMYLGSSSCIEISREDLMSMYYHVLGGDQWKPRDRVNWLDYDAGVCSWAGITCDEDGEISSVSLPMQQYPTE